MKRFTKASLLTLILICGFLFGGSLASPVSINAADYTSVQTSENDLPELRIFNEIIDNQLAASGLQNLQQWADNALASGAGLSTDWYAFLLAKTHPEINLDKYAENLLDYIENNTSGAVTEQKYALCLITCGSKDERTPAYLSDICDRTIGKQGIMSLIYGLKLLDEGLPCSTYSVDDVLNALLEMRTADGGWSVFGSSSDVDVTAMCLQSLSRHKDKEEIGPAVETALSLLSARQEQDAGYKSMGVCNPESAAQVMIALSQLGINYRTDERFIKNGRNILDSIRDFMTEPGLFAHEAGKEANGLATLQTAMACEAFLEYAGKVPFEEEKQDSEIISSDGESSHNEKHSGISDETDKSGNDLPEKTDEISSISSQDEGKIETQSQSQKKLNTKLVLQLIVAAASLTMLVVCALRRRGWKSYAFTILVGGALLLLITNAEIQSVSEYYSNTKTDNQIRIEFSLDTSVVKNGTVKTTEIDLPSAATAYDALAAYCRAEKLQMETVGVGTSIYVKGIDYLYEFDHGDLSGWMYEVNGSQPSVGSASYVLGDKDKVVWFYTREMGHDR